MRRTRALCKFNGGKRGCDDTPGMRDGRQHAMERDEALLKSWNAGRKDDLGKWEKRLVG